ncbi:MAG: glycosyltransferase family 39 protein [Armatimonadota bacterium]
MDRSDGGSTQTFLHRGHNYALVLAGLAVVLIIVMAPMSELGCDESAWAVSVGKLLHGRVLGAGAVLAKGPYLVLAHLIPYVIFGPNVFALHLINTLWALAVGALVCVMAHRIAGRWGTVAGAVLYIGGMADPFLRFNFYAETIFMLPLAAGMLLVVSGIERKRPGAIFFAGLLGGMAVLVKQTSAVAVLAMVVALWLAPGRREWKDATKKSLTLLAGSIIAAVPWAIYQVAFRDGSGDPGMVDTAVGYLSQMDLPQALANLQWTALHVLPRYSIVILTSLAGLHLLYHTWRRSRADGGEGDIGGTWAAVIGLWYLAAVAAIASTGRFSAHYFNQFIPVAALAGGVWAADALAGGLKRRRIAGAALVAQAVLVVIFAIVGVTGWTEALATTREPTEWREVGRYLREHTTPDDTVFVWGDQTEVVYWAGRELAARNPWITNRIIGYRHLLPVFAERIDEEIDWPVLVEHLETWWPRYVVVAPRVRTVPPDDTCNYGTEDLPELKRILRQHYERETTIRGYELWRRTPQAPQPAVEGEGR